MAYLPATESSQLVFDIDTGLLQPGAQERPSTCQFTHSIFNAAQPV
jgi:hypothetical protein